MFFFKQKTAYEMRISDWSSDVCSSDLDYPRSRWLVGPSLCCFTVGADPPQCSRFTFPIEKVTRRFDLYHRKHAEHAEPHPNCQQSSVPWQCTVLEGTAKRSHVQRQDRYRPFEKGARSPICGARPPVFHRPDHRRSEEHTSALQPLMRHSSADFCLKQKTKTH